VSLLNNLSKFFSRSWQERGLFVEAFVLLGVMRAAILLLPFRKIAGMMGLVQGSTPLETVLPMSVNPADIGWAIQAAAIRTHWESACLAQALTGMAMLARRGGNATLYLGVARDESGVEAMKAHAWLRCGDTILTGAAGYNEFVTISTFTRGCDGQAAS